MALNPGGNTRFPGENLRAFRAAPGRVTYVDPPAPVSQAELERPHRKKLSPWEQRLLEEGLAPVCEFCGGTGVVNRRAPRNGCAPRYTEDGKLVIPEGITAQPGPAKAWFRGSFTLAVASTFQACVGRLIFGVHECPCPRCHPKPQRGPRLRKSLTAKQERYAKRNRELLDLVEESSLEQAEAALAAVCETIVEAAANPDPDSPTCRPDQDAGETVEVVELEVAQ